MKVGIFGSTAVQAAGGGMGTISHEEDVLATNAFIEAGELAHEAESDYADMVQANVVGAKLDTQAAMVGTMLGKPESITSGTVAMARESMELALVALGGGVSDYQVSTESMEAAPLQALEVTTEGIKDVAKKIYESIKMVFKKIALTMKKMTAKLVVAMDGTSNLAEKMLASFMKKGAKLTPQEFDEKTALSIVTRGSAFEVIADTVSDSKYAIYRLTTNLEAVRDYCDLRASDYTALVAAITKLTEDNADGDHVVTALKEGSFKSAQYVAASNAAKFGKAATAFKGLGSGLSELKLSADQLAEVSLPEGATSPVFYPTFVKGSKIHGVVFYVPDVESIDTSNPRELLGSVTFSNASFTAVDEAGLVASAKALKVMTVSEIEKALTVLKPATKALQLFAAARLKDVDRAMKEIDKAAKASSGIAVLNRIAGTEFNKTRMFIAGNYISTIFALAAYYRNEMTTVALHIKQYK